MLLVHTIRIYPSDPQIQKMDLWMRLARRIWNHFLEHRIKIHKRRGESTSYMTQTKMLTKWRENDERMREMPVEFQRDAINRLHKAFDGFFRRVKGGERPGYPRFKGKGRWKTLCYLKAGDYVKGGKIFIPKVGLVKCRNLRMIDGEIKSLRVTRRCNRWFAQILIDDGKTPPQSTFPQSKVGIDVGLESFATLSTGEQIENPRFTRKMAKKMRRAQRVMCRRKKGSKRRIRARAVVAKLHMNVADARKDFAHKLSKRLVGENDLIAVEALNMNGLVRGRFAKSVHDAGWSHFRWCLRYKAERAGHRVVEVDPRGTSQTCSGCGSRCPKTLNVRKHHCANCGLELHRDHNAALNILSRVPPVGREFTHVETPIPGRSRCAAGKGRRNVKAGRFPIAKSVSVIVE